MNPLVPLLTGRVADGVWRTSIRPPGAAALVESFGRLALVVDTNGDKGHVLDSFARAGRFPDWVGRNWDALDDALGDLSWLPGLGVVILVESEPPVLEDGPWSILIDVLAGATRTWTDRGRPFSTVVIGATAPRSVIETVPDLADLVGPAFVQSPLSRSSGQ